MTPEKPKPDDWHLVTSPGPIRENKDDPYSKVVGWKPFQYMSKWVGRD